jgi:hypothetical protein
MKRIFGIEFVEKKDLENAIEKIRIKKSTMDDLIKKMNDTEIKLKEFEKKFTKRIDELESTWYWSNMDHSAYKITFNDSDYLRCL